MKKYLVLIPYHAYTPHGKVNYKIKFSKKNLLIYEFCYLDNTYEGLSFHSFKTK